MRFEGSGTITLFPALLWIQIWIRRIPKFLDLPVLDSDLDPDPDPSTHPAKIVKKTLVSTVLLRLFDFLFLKTDVNIPSKKMSRVHNTGRKLMNFDGR